MVHDPTLDEALPVDLSPCKSCGACCAGLRVLFHEDHVAPRGLVPRTHVAPSGIARHVVLRGTRGGRCVALEGTVGECVGCSIYERRPPPCRDFAFSGDGGVASEACDAARARHGLEPLLSRR